MSNAVAMFSRSFILPTLSFAVACVVSNTIFSVVVCQTAEQANQGGFPYIDNSSKTSSQQRQTRLSECEAVHQMGGERRAKRRARFWMRSIFAMHHAKPFRALLTYFPFCLMVFLVQPELAFSKGGGSGSGTSSRSSGGGGYYSGGGSYSSSSNSRWVFWYTADGSRSCGNLCIITFSIIGAIILMIIGCGVYRCYRIHEKDKNDLEKGMVNISSNSQFNYSAPPSDVYPPIPSPSPTPEDSSPPPNYETTAPAPEPIHQLGKYNEASSLNADAAKDFTHRYPPKEELPPNEHQVYIRNQGGVRAWQMVATPNLGVQVTDHGHVVCFSKKKDAMAQANYPMFTPEDKPTIDTTVHLNKQTERDHDQLSSPAVTDPAPPYFFVGPSKSPELETSSNQVSFVRRSRSFENDDLTSDDLKNDVKVFHYFEITVKQKPIKNTVIAIGLTTKPYPEFRLPGWNHHSVGYHSDDGRKFCDDSYGGRDYTEGSEWKQVGDTVGCGYYPETGFVFFTKNGNSMGTAFTGQRHVYFPTVGADGPCTVEVNFGDREFAYKEAKGYNVAGVTLIKNCH